MARAYSWCNGSVGIGGCTVTRIRSLTPSSSPPCGARLPVRIPSAHYRASALRRGTGGRRTQRPLNSTGILASLVWAAAIELASGLHIDQSGFASPSGHMGAATEVSRGKDTASGTAELGGLPRAVGLALAFPRLSAVVSRPNCWRSLRPLAGTDEIWQLHAPAPPFIEEFGSRNISRLVSDLLLRRPDSVLQIAAHEERLLACKRLA